MKRIALLFVSVFVGAALLSAQTTQTPESLLKAKAKSDEDIQNPKKNTKSATWEKRGDLFLDMAQFNTKGLYAGMLQKGLGSAEMMVGKPEKIENNVTEDWIYERVTLHFENGKLKSWDETKPLDLNSLDEAYKAYLKADELDPKFNKKVNVKQNISTLRGMFTNRGVQLYSEKKYKEAVSDLDKALRLNEFPKMPTDTIFNTGLVTYYAGLIAQSGNDFETAKKYYSKCIEKELELGNAYAALASVYKTEGNSTKELETLQEGFKKTPESKEIMVGFINYYLTSGQSELALEKLNTAVKDDPQNPTFHYAIGTLYDTMLKDSTDKYSKEEKETFMKKAIESYKTAIDLRADYFEALYNTGAVYFNEAVRILKEADKLPLNKKKEFDEMTNKAMEQFKLALPYMEKAHDVNKQDRSALLTLVTLYHKLQMYDKKKEAQEKLSELPEETNGGL